jgi:hypothetical protein
VIPLSSRVVMRSVVSCPFVVDRPLGESSARLIDPERTTTDSEILRLSTTAHKRRTTDHRRVRARSALPHDNVLQEQHEHGGGRRGRQGDPSPKSCRQRKTRHIWSHRLPSGRRERPPGFAAVTPHKRPDWPYATDPATMRPCAQQITRPSRTSGKITASVRQVQAFSVTSRLSWLTEVGSNPDHHLEVAPSHLRPRP